MKKPAAKPRSPAARYVALLRGINVSGKNMIPMPRLSAAFAAAGCTDVETFIQSGNVVFAASASTLKTLTTRISQTLASEFDYHVPIIVRSAQDLERIVRDNPFLAAGADVAHQHVMFMSATPTAQRVAALDPQRSPGDQFQVLGQELYLCLPNGVGRSKLSNAFFDSKLGVVSSGRNWRTVLKLKELAAG